LCSLLLGNLKPLAKETEMKTKSKKTKQEKLKRKLKEKVERFKNQYIIVPEKKAYVEVKKKKARSVPRILTKPKAKPVKLETGVRRTSSGETRIAKYLDFIAVKYLREWEHKYLINPKTKCHLYIDFYLPEYNSAIEYDGYHHYHGDSWELESQQYRDKVKNRFCERNKINLLRIPYWEGSRVVEIVEEFIREIEILNIK
jgi:hypothetical protein